MSRALKMPIAFDEADGEGIVFFGNYFRLAHRALEQYLPLIGISWEDWFRHKDYGVPLRHVEADYLGPIFPGQTIEIHVKILELGESSVKFGFEFRDPKGRPTSHLQTTHVFVGREARRKTAVPEAIRARLLADQEL